MSRALSNRLEYSIECIGDILDTAVWHWELGNLIWIRFWWNRLQSQACTYRSPGSRNISYVNSVRHTPNKIEIYSNFSGTFRCIRVYWNFSKRKNPMKQYLRFAYWVLPACGKENFEMQRYELIPFDYLWEIFYKQFYSLILLNALKKQFFVFLHKSQSQFPYR